MLNIAKCYLANEFSPELNGQGDHLRIARGVAQKNEVIPPGLRVVGFCPGGRLGRLDRPEQWFILNALAPPLGTIRAQQGSQPHSPARRQCPRGRKLHRRRRLRPTGMQIISGPGDWMAQLG